MRDRLVKLLHDVECKGEEEFGNCPERRYGRCRTVQKLEMCQIGVIADHLLANGVIVPPCKVGDMIYALNYDRNGYVPLKVTSRESLVRWMDEDQFGNTLFITREEAERALKGEHHAEIH